jgi:hypothetical protein
VDPPEPRPDGKADGAKLDALRGDGAKGDGAKSDGARGDGPKPAGQPKSVSPQSVSPQAVSPRVRDELAGRGESGAAPAQTRASTPRPRDEQAEGSRGMRAVSTAVARGRGPEPKPPEPKPPVVEDAVPEGDDDDGKTMPGYDFEQLERDRLAHLARKGGAAPPFADDSGGRTDEGEIDASEEKTRAGVSMSSEAPEPPPPVKPVEPDAHARALLEKVNQLAPRSQPLPRVAADTVRPAWEAATNETPRNAVTADVSDVGPMRAVTAPNIDADLPGAAVADDVANPQPGFGVVPVADELPQPLPPLASVPATAPARRPGAWYGLVGASAGMAAIAVSLLIVGAVVPSSATTTTYGVVAVKAAPAGAVAVFAGVSTPTPGQIVVPLDGGEYTIDVVLPGHKTRTEKIVFAPGANSAAVNVTLDPG